MNTQSAASTSKKPLRVLFVCLGNICRSPLAEVVIKEAANNHTLGHLFHFESAGTGDWHIGKGADTRSAAIASHYGLNLGQHKAQQITAKHIPNWDVFVAMDQANKRNLLAMGAHESQVLMMRSFEDEDTTLVADVPDPYYGGATGFKEAYQMLKDNADGLLGYLKGYKG